VSKFPRTKVLKGTRHDLPPNSYPVVTLWDSDQVRKAFGKEQDRVTTGCFIYVKNAVVFIINRNFVTNKTFLLCVILGTIFEIFYQLHIGLYQLSLYLNSADLFFAL